jgi:hypothetical protein
MVVGLAGLQGNVRGVAPEGAGAEWVLHHPWPAPLAWAMVALGLLLLGAAVVVWQRRATAEPGAHPAASAALGTAVAAAAVLAAFVGRDLSWDTAARPQGNERLIQLFIYKYDRPWPEHLDYRPVLTAFAIVATALLAVAVFHRLRPLAGRAFLGLALVMAAWTINVYMVDLSPHWGQRELFKTYYELRKGPEEPVIAYQMNWKGENFYTGNRAHIFVKLDNKALRDWLTENKGRTAFFVLEHTRLGNFKTLVRDGQVEQLTDKRLNNKFLLLRAQL